MSWIESAERCVKKAALLWQRYAAYRAKKIKRRRTVVQSHWAKLMECFNTSTLDFYTKVQEALERREVPGLESGLVEWSEGGPLSAKRTYLRLVRERIVIDVCAAPFGTGFFFSWRLCEVPLKIRWWMVLIFLFILQFVWGLFVVAFDDIYWGTIVMLIVVFGPLLVMKILATRNLADIDAVILKMPFLSILYERHLRRLTYFRVDSMMMYEQAVHAAVMEVIDELTSAQGVATLTGDDRRPIMRDVYGR